jgi:5,10-methylenetetrahydrofolate reductase
MLLARKWAVRHAGVLEKAYRLLAHCLQALRPLLHAIGYERLEWPMRRIEGAVKGFLFDCKMCGECTLALTGMSCWKNCPKGNRNGPCGGVRPNSMCEVNPQIRCVWVESWRGSERMTAKRLPVTPHPPIDHSLAERSSWLRIAREQASPNSAPVVVSAAKQSGGKLEQLLREGVFVVTAEFSPPDSADPEEVSRRLPPFAGYVDALNVTDGSGANCHMSSVAVSTLLARAGCEPVMQITCRDRNRIAIQGDILGAAALGIRNLLCLTGDHVCNGDHPGSKHVGDLDAVSLLNTARTLRDEGRFLSGRAISSSPHLLLGAADNPFAPPLDLRPARLRRKILAGAQFVQTQYCFDIPLLERYMDRVRAEGLDEQCFIIAGVGPVGSARTARWLREKVPGVHIPDEIVVRLEKAANPKEEGKRICIELLQRIRGIRGIAGVHLMTPKQDHLIPELVSAAGLRDRRRVMGQVGPCHSRERVETIHAA